jgi:hypothetical protein
LERPEPISFTELPDLNKYSEYFSPSVAEFHTAFYCNALENQIYSAWDETMNLLHAEGYRSKFNLCISKQNIHCEDSKLEISSGWVDALNAVIKKVESLQDSNMSSESRANRDKKKNRTESSGMNDSLMNNSITTTTNNEHNTDRNNVEPSNTNEVEPVSRVKEKEDEEEDDIPPPPPPPPLPPPSTTATTTNDILPTHGNITDVVMEDVDSSSASR